MDAQVLVLSRSYEPLQQICWTKAFKLLFKGSAELVEEYTDKVVRSVSETFAVPSIIRLVQAKARRRSIRYSPENVYLRDKLTCQYCSKKLKRYEATRDHVIPRAQGGKTSWDNIVTCCTPCNQFKGGRTPEQAGMRLLMKPVKPRSLPTQKRQLGEVHESWIPYLEPFGLT